MKSVYLSEIRKQNPLIHNITNIVAANFSANGLLALGASPLMSANIEEMVELPKISQALVINIGTVIDQERDAMLLAGKTANSIGIPVVLDPVGVGATSYRRETIRQLLVKTGKQKAWMQDKVKRIYKKSLNVLLNAMVAQY